MAATSLPKISPKGTPVATPPSPAKSVHSYVCTPPVIAAVPTAMTRPKTLQNIHVPSVYEPFPPRLITSIDNVDFRKIPSKVNPLAPAPPQRRTAMLETVEPHWENNQRSDLMQKMHRSRYHTAYQKWAYGSPAEKEIYRRLFREGLKQQMSDRDSKVRQTFDARVRESEEAVQKDRQDIVKDSQDYHNHFNQMKTFRDANKSLMEEQWNWNRRSRYLNWRHEEELLKYNPINWSCSMK
ncbi:uncharacterized protein LOC135491366 isoform X2 [Lineus longissimus]|uniref:uncharacterized protein LOC135491366 isoform X2 n=1 Tax=Lineus longissimus TaxID=88925 RepID=UPI00315DFA85